MSGEKCFEILDKIFVPKNKQKIEDIKGYKIKYGKIVEKQGRHGRPIYEFKYEGKIRRIAITVGDNGYIVGANPVSLPKEDQ